ncbi:hypothetical protein DM02DRAFT_266158 [Periconia macrospinosa]|uniref:C2H2-type domain-containing protein n=1 Tax=Periconia macrospinosa TaxID=97972 RepID=A0A2V1D3Z6_9PLEO|nr:hypothetical protein DM02DRAFT_266158 [Periconia macrospinosa]
MTTFFTHDPDMAYMSPDENMGHLFPSSTCQSPPSIMYSPPLHQVTHRVPSTPQPGLGQMYPSTQDYRSVPSSPYPAPNYWNSQPPAMPQTHVTYSSYPPLSVMSPGQALVPEAALLSQPLINRPARSHSASSLGMASTSTGDRSPPSMSRSMSPGSPDLRNYGFANKNGTWSCAYPGCTSRAVFTRGCDLRKHHKRHTKSFFCRHEGCPQATGGGFSSKKDLARHEAKHNPGVLCDWDGCDRVFSRVDNMRDHVKRIHLKASRHAAAPKSVHSS